jgi:hypothetical protein
MAQRLLLSTVHRREDNAVAGRSLSSGQAMSLAQGEAERSRDVFKASSHVVSGAATAAAAAAAAAE